MDGCAGLQEGELSNHDDLWKCRWCGKWFVVPNLARDHEEKCDCRSE